MAVLDIREMLKMSIRDEETGIAFYTALAERAGSDEARTILLEMAEQEKHHAERFRNMLGELGNYRTRESYTGEYENYMQVLLSGRTYVEPAEAARQAQGVKNIAEALDIALGMERDALLFYMEIRNFVDEDYKKYINAIMDEERNHVYELTQLKQKYS